MAGNGRCKTSAAQTETELRQIEAVRLKREGKTFQEIADMQGYANRSCAYGAYMAGLTKSRSREADALREEQGAMLDELLVEPYEAALEGDLDALNVVLKIMERKSRLHCLDRKDVPIRIKLPKLEKAADAAVVVGALVEKVTAGEISPDDAERIAGLLGVFTRTAETAELAERFKTLENIAKEKGLM